MSKTPPGECKTCEIRDKIWDMREAAIHWRKDHPRELEVLRDALTLAGAQSLGWEVHYG